MLQKIRERATGIIGIIIIVLISITFAFWGIQNYFMGAADPVVATINDITITRQEFEGRYGQYRQRLASQGIDVSFLDDPVRRREFLEQMIDAEVWWQAARRSGLEASPTEIRRQIENIDAFHVNGRFDAGVYLQMLELQGLTPQELEADLQRQLLVQRIPEVVTDSQFATGAELDRLATLQNQQRTFDYLVIPAAEFEDVVEVTEEDITAYYEANRSRFREPERVSVEYVELKAADQAVEIVADEHILRDRFEREKDRYRVPERRLASHILIEIPDDPSEGAVAEAEQAAVELAAQAREQPERFTELAREHSDDFSASEGGDLGWISEGDMVEAFEETLFSLEEGAISDPVRTGFGFHVIHLREIEPSRGKTFEEAREELAAEYREAEAERQFLDIQDQLEERLNYSDAPDMEGVAEEFGLELRVAGPFSRTGGTGLMANRQVLEAAFSEMLVEDGLVSDPIIVEPNHVVFLRVMEHLAAEDKPLEAVRDEAAAAVRRDKAREAARERAEALLASLESGEASLAEIAAGDDGLALNSADAVGRNAADHPRPLLQAVFELPKPGKGVGYHLVPFQGDRFAVVALESVAEPDPAVIADAQKAALALRLERSFSAAEVAALSEALRKTATIQINEEILNASP